MENQTLRCKGLKKSFKSKEVLHGIDLRLEAGKIYGLIGRNGVGKTTLLSVISAQSPASDGEVMLGEENVWENQKALDCICFSRELNPVANNVIAGMKVSDYLETAAIYYPKWDNEMAERLVKEFELDGKKRINKLSKGMLSMITIIVALASKSEFTFLDEPVAGLDVFMREKFYQLLLEEYTESGRTFVVSTHIIDEAANVFEEVIMIKNGEIILQENTDELLGRAAHVSGKCEDVDAAVNGLECHHEQIIGRSKGVTVFLKEGQSVRGDFDVSVQPVSLQNVFVALGGEE